MPTFRYCLDTKKPRKKFNCPGCGKTKVFVRYIDTENGEYLPEKYGKCDRDNKCTYSLNPYEDGYNKTVRQQEKNNGIKYRPKIKQVSPAVSFIPTDAFKESLNVNSYKQNNFINYLFNLFGRKITTSLIEKYFIGTSKHLFFRPDIHPTYVSAKGATVFWKVDIHGRITAGKVMLYNSDTGKRIKEPFDHVDSAHNLMKLSEPRAYQCLFGEHLLIGNSKPVAIVESEKSAIIISAYLPDYIWLATGSLDMLTADRCKVLKGRNVTLFPDLNKGFEKWSKKAKELSDITKFIVSDFLETNANEKEKEWGLDLADYLTKFNIQTILKDSFRKEFLRKDELLPEHQLQVWLEYERKGLHPFCAKEIILELINKHGFIIVD